MKTFFVEQSKKTRRIKSIFNEVSKKENKIIINRNLQKTKFKTKIRIAKKIKNILEIEKSRQIVVEKELKNDKELINLLYSYNINICNPKWLFKKLTNEIIENILQEKKKEENEIYICVNEVDSIIEEYIYKFAKEFKTITILTNHIRKFKKIEEKLYNDEGILINVTNNKRKGLIKAKLILNVDFPKEILNQFAIFDDAVIINLEGEMKIKKKRFKGRIINDYNITLNKESEIYKFIKENHLQNYDERDIFQAIEYPINKDILLEVF